MKKIFLSAVFILLSGILIGQTFQKGNLVGFHVGTITLNTDATLKQWKHFALETFLPAFNKEFDGEVIQYLSCGERGKFKDYIGIHIVFRSVEIRDKYISAEGMTTKLYAEKFAKVKPLWDELEKIGVFSRDHFTDWVIQ